MDTENMMFTDELRLLNELPSKVTDRVSKMLFNVQC